MKEMPQSNTDRIEKICEILRDQTLQPARQEADEIIENAKIEAKAIVDEAHQRAEESIARTEKENREKKKVFDSSLAVACRQTIEELKQKLEKELFSKTLSSALKEHLSSADPIAKIINVLIEAIEKEGTDSRLEVSIGKNISPDEVNAYLIDRVKKKLAKKEIVIGNFDSGMKVKLIDDEISFDLSKETLNELIAQFLRSDFRKMIFEQ